MWIFLIIMGYVIGCLYAAWQFAWWLKRTRWGHKHKEYGVIILLCAIDTIPIFGAFLPQSTFDAYLQKIGNMWLGWVAVFGLCLVVGHIIKHFIHMVSTRQATVILLTMFAITAAYNIYGYIHAQHIYTHYYALKMNTNSTELVDEKLIGHDYVRINEDMAYQAKADEKITRVALLADMHMGVNTRYATIEDLVDIVKSSDVDYIIGGGDYFTSSYVGLFGADKYADLLAEMTADGTPAYMAYGNHDVTEPLFCGFAIEKPKDVFRYQDMERFFKRINWQMLGDQAIDVDGIQFFFRKDASKTGDGKNERMSVSELGESVENDRPLVVVQHEPEGYDQLATIGADLVLSGHTHDGQIWPGTWFTRLVSENSHGYKINDGISTLVSSGCGYFGPPLRLGSHSEVVVIDIVR